MLMSRGCTTLRVEQTTSSSAALRKRFEKRAHKRVHGQYGAHTNKRCTQCVGGLGSIKRFRRRHKGTKHALTCSVVSYGIRGSDSRAEEELHSADP
jgi:hypothetical protein